MVRDLGVDVPFTWHGQGGDLQMIAGSPTDPIYFILHYGFQNLLDPALDEWIIIQKFADTPGAVTLPAECSGKCKHDLFALPLYCK